MSPFGFSEKQLQVKEQIEAICDRFDEAYWMDHDDSGEFPSQFVDALADAGWLGIALPESFSGHGLGITEGALMTQAITRSKAGVSGISAVAINIFGLNPLVKFGSEDLQRRSLPGMISGRDRACFGVTEPETGLNTTNLKTKAVRKGDHYYIHGAKVWTSTAQVANKIMLIARTTPIEETARPIDGLSLFYADFDRDYVEVRRIEKMGRKCVDSNQVFFDGLPIPVENRVGEEGQGFRYLLHGLNPERVLIAAGCVGLGQNALALAAEYAGKTKFDGRIIGQDQGVQHPLAECWMELEAANLMVFKAAALYDAGQSCGAEANAAKYLAAEAAFKTCTQAVMTMGVEGLDRDNQVERYFRESLIHRLAPISPQLIKCFIAEKVLGLPKSY